MARFTITVGSDLPVDEAWRRVLDLRGHDRVIPLTRLERGQAPAEDLHDGWEFLAWTGIGPLGYDDPMVVAEIAPPQGQHPGHCRVVKCGRVVGGEAMITVAPRPSGGSTIIWDQDWRIEPLPRATDPLTAFGARLGYQYVIARLLARRSGRRARPRS